MLSTFTLVLLSAHVVYCNLSLHELYTRGFQLPSPTQGHQASTKPPKHLLNLLNDRSWTKHKNGDINRVVSVTPRNMIRYEMKQEVSFFVPKVDGDVVGLQICIPTKRVVNGADIKLTFSNKFELKSAAVPDLTTAEIHENNIIRGKIINITLMIHKTVHFEGVTAEISKPIKDVLNLKQSVYINILVHNKDINSADRISYRHEILAIVQQKRRQKRVPERRSFSFCSKRDLVVNFHDLGYTNILAPVEYDAFHCSGQCHLSHDAMHMTNHAFIQNLLYFSGVGVRGAACVPEETAPISVLVHDGTDFYVTVYKDMTVKTCSCR